MKRKRFSEEQIIAVLREHDAGAKAADLARKHGVSEATLYNWKAKYGGLDVSEAKRLKALEGVFTLSEIGPIWTIDQQAKSLKSLASTLAIVGKFRSV